MKAHLAELQHGWVSVVAKTEAYNEAFFDEQKVKDFSKFLRLNPQVGRHFNKTPLHQTLIFGFKHGNPFGYIQYLPPFPQIIEITILDDLGVSQASCH